MAFVLLFRAAAAIILGLVLSAGALPQCPIQPGKTERAAAWDTILTQDGPGKGLEPKGSPGWTGGDSTYSLLLPNGDTAFFFSDSYIGEWPKAKGDGTVTRSASGLRTTEINCPAPICEPPASSFIARNSIVILSSDGKRMRTLVGPKNENGLSTSYFKDPAAGLYYWMGDAILLPKRGKAKRRILVFLHKFDAKLNLKGIAVAQLDPGSLAVERTTEIADLPDLDIHWGTAMLREGDHLYVYGKGTRDGRKQMFVARAKVDAAIGDLARSSSWSAWDGAVWTNGLTNAVPVIPATDSISDEFNIARFDVNGRPTYILAAVDSTAPWGAWRDITLYSACSPQGPFTGKHVVYAMPESQSFTVPGLPADVRLNEHLVVYNPHIHPQFSGNGRLLISYNINRTNNRDSIYIDGYRPRFIYVPIAGLK